MMLVLMVVLLAVVAVPDNVDGSHHKKYTHNDFKFSHFEPPLADSIAGCQHRSKGDDLSIRSNVRGAHKINHLLFQEILLRRVWASNVLPLCYTRMWQYV